MPGVIAPESIFRPRAGGDFLVRGDPSSGSVEREEVSGLPAPGTVIGLGLKEANKEANGVGVEADIGMAFF
jgi:hypothetical protein